MKVLMGARRSFNENPHKTPVERHMWRHRQYGPIHRQYFIPLDYMALDLFFEKLREPDYMQTVYWKRCCSLYDYYVMLSKDNPVFKPKRNVQSTQSRPSPHDYRPRPIAHNPYVSGDKSPSDKWGKGLMSSAQSSSGVTA